MKRWSCNVLPFMIGYSKIFSICVVGNLFDVTDNLKSRSIRSIRSNAILTFAYSKKLVLSTGASDNLLMETRNPRNPISCNTGRSSVVHVNVE